MNLRKLARGKNCMVRIPRVCNFNDETTVLAHIKLAGFAGIAQKMPDFMGSWCCSSCHDVIDGRVKSDYTQDEIKIMKYEGMIRTQCEILKMGAMK